jgi:protocatechuate 4,5-dioxygenase alpha chain
MAITTDYEDIPGTYVFNGRRCREGYYLNMFCKSLDKSKNREAFRENSAKYISSFPMTDKQRELIENRDWLGMLKVGGNIYYTFKLAIFDGLTMQHVGGMMSHMTVDDFKQMMIDGGRSVEGNKSIKENSNG